jgi:hypothetical protein
MLWLYASRQEEAIVVFLNGGSQDRFVGFGISDSFLSFRDSQATKKNAVVGSRIFELRDHQSWSRSFIE